MRLYAIYDKLAEESGPIFEAKNDGVAWRMVRNELKSLNSGEFELVYLGYYSHDPVFVDGASMKIVVSSSDFVEDEPVVEEDIK